MKRYFLLISVLFLMVLTGCSNEENSGSVTSIKVQPNFKIEFTQQDLQTCEGLKSFYVKLMAEVLDNDALVEFEGKNFAISPLSCAIDMAMLANSTDNLSAKKICKILEVTDLETLGAACNKLMTYLPAPENGAEFGLANAVWYADRNAPYIPDSYIKSMNSTYFADVNSADLASESGKGVINAWVNSKTNGLIKNLDGLYEPSPSTEALILNALYFNGEWDSKFEVKRTKGEIFNAPDRDVSVKMMHNTLRTTAYEDDKRIMFRLPFKYRESYMVFVLPNEGCSLTDAWSDIENCDSGWSAYDLKVSVPKFSTESTLKLGQLPMLQTVGACSLNGMGIPTGRIGKIGQKTSVNIDEEGAKMAAVTTDHWVTADNESVKKGVVVLDRPFLFYVNNFKTGAVIMAGRVLDPTKN